MKPKPKKAKIIEQIWSVKAQTVNKTSYRPELNLYGTVESSNNTIITSVITADVNLVLALERQFVEKGQTIISLIPKILIYCFSRDRQKLMISRKN